MNPEDALLNYLYPRLVEALQTWKGFDDIYGIWLFIGLADEYRSQTELMHALVLRESVAYEREHSYGTRWAPGFLSRPDEEIRFRPFLCSAPWPPDAPDYDYMRNDTDIRDPGDPKGFRLREAFFGEKNEQRSDPNPQPHLEYLELLWFLDICGQLIRRLHADGTLEMFFGQAVPIGIFFNNDLPATLALPITRDSNPPEFADEMLDWLRGQG